VPGPTLAGIVSPGNLHENFAWNGGCGGAFVGDRRGFGAEHKHDEWWQLGRRLDGGIRRNVGTDPAGRRRGRPRGVDRQTQVKVIEPVPAMLRRWLT